jgi:hypothetical protein
LEAVWGGRAGLWAAKPTAAYHPVSGQQGDKAAGTTTNDTHRSKEAASSVCSVYLATGYHPMTMKFNDHPMKFNDHTMKFNDHPMKFNDHPMKFNDHPMTTP